MAEITEDDSVATPEKERFKRVMMKAAVVKSFSFRDSVENEDDSQAQPSPKSTNEQEGITPEAPDDHKDPTDDENQSGSESSPHQTKENQSSSESSPHKMTAAENLPDANTETTNSHEPVTTGETTNGHALLPAAETSNSETLVTATDTSNGQAPVDTTQDDHVAQPSSEGQSDSEATRGPEVSDPSAGSDTCVVQVTNGNAPDDHVNGNASHQHASGGGEGEHVPGSDPDGNEAADDDGDVKKKRGRMRLYAVLGGLLGICCLGVIIYLIVTYTANTEPSVNPNMSDVTTSATIERTEQEGITPSAGSS